MSLGSQLLPLQNEGQPRLSQRPKSTSHRETLPVGASGRGSFILPSAIPPLGSSRLPVIDAAEKQPQHTARTGGCPHLTEALHVGHAALTATRTRPRPLPANRECWGFCMIPRIKRLGALFVFVFIITQSSFHWTRKLAPWSKSLWNADPGVWASPLTS